MILSQKVNGSVVSKGAMNSFQEMFALVRMFPLAVMHRGIVIKTFNVLQFYFLHLPCF